MAPYFFSTDFKTLSLSTSSGNDSRYVRPRLRWSQGDIGAPPSCSVLSWMLVNFRCRAANGGGRNSLAPVFFLSVLLSFLPLIDSFRCGGGTWRACHAPNTRRPPLSAVLDRPYLSLATSLSFQLASMRLFRSLLFPPSPFVLPFPRNPTRLFVCGTFVSHFSKALTFYAAVPLTFRTSPRCFSRR